MARTLKTVKLDGDAFLEEVVCEDYKCASCGKKMISVNFVNGVCIQVFATHKPECEIFEGSPVDRTVEVTCESCLYYDGTGCTYEGKTDARIESVRRK